MNRSQLTVHILGAALLGVASGLILPSLGAASPEVGGLAGFGVFLWAICIIDQRHQILRHVVQE